MKYRHEMPFGAQVGAETSTRFRLWAPSAKHVVLDAEPAAGSRLQADLSEAGEGWYELVVTGIGAGAKYKYRIDDEIDVPDPASRFNPQGVQGASEIVDAQSFAWNDTAWRGREWHEAVVYETHIGTFTEEGTYSAAIARLDELRDLGVTALELMPLAAFPGRRGWGYDAVLPYAPHAAYGRPEDLKRLIRAAHERELMVLLDVVYNHFGPEGNYLPRYARQLYTSKHHTPWGDAINFAEPVVRQFFIHNALYWLDEYRFDGLRIDAVHAMYDDSARHFIDELVQTVSDGPGRERKVHVVLENHRNEAYRLGPRPHSRPLPDPPPATGGGDWKGKAGAASSTPSLPRSPRQGEMESIDVTHLPLPRSPGEGGVESIDVAHLPLPRSPGEGGVGAIHVSQWNDDFHHPLHVMLSGESDGYYVDYADEPVGRLGRVLAEGFAYQGERSRFSGEPRGGRSVDLPPAAFVNFLQNHDQIGNRAYGERLAQLTEPEQLRAALAILLLSPQIPMLFMGEEYAAPQPFLYFCDYQGELAEAISKGRREEFAVFAAFADEKQRTRIPDPNLPATFERSRLIWPQRERPPHAQWLHYTRGLLSVRARKVAPLIPEILLGQSTYHAQGPVLTVQWPTRAGSTLRLDANLGDTDEVTAEPMPTAGDLLFSISRDAGQKLAAWDVRVLSIPAATAGAGRNGGGRPRSESS